MKKVIIGNATLYQGDCLEILNEINEVDAVITDPPYSSGGMFRSDRSLPTKEKYVGSSVKTEYNVDFFGDNRDSRSWNYWLTLVLSKAFIKTNDNSYCMIFTDWRQLPTATDVFQASGFVWRGLIPWNKTASSRAPHTRYFRHQCEYVIWGSKGKLNKSTTGGSYNGYIEQRVNPRLKLHMTGKPIEVMDHLIKPVPKNSIILDPFMGSASTGVAAINAGHKFIGVELSEHYFDVACERLTKLQNL